MTTIRPLVRMRHKDGRTTEASTFRAFQLQSLGWRRIDGAELPAPEGAPAVETAPDPVSDAPQSTDSGPPDTEQQADTSTKTRTKRS